MERDQYFQEVVLPIEALPMRIFCFKGRDNHPGYPFHWHRDAEIILCLSGCMNAQINEKRYCLTEGKILFVNPNEVHGTYTEPRSEMMVLQISHDLLSRLTQQLHFTIDEEKLFNSEDTKEIQLLLKQMYVHFNINEKGAKIKMLSLLYDFCYRMVRDYQKTINKVQVVSQKKIDLLDSVCNYIYQHQSEPISLNAIAQIFSYTPQYLSNIFKKYLNITFNEYVNSLRVDASLDLLLNSDYSLSQISDKCGFASLRTFNREFKKVYGITPKEFKNKEDYIISYGLKYRIV